MTNLVKTTITLPEDLFMAIKMKAVREKTNVSALLRLGLIKQLQQLNDKPINNVRQMQGFIPTKRHRTEKDFDEAIAQSVTDSYSTDTI